MRVALRLLSVALLLLVSAVLARAQALSGVDAMTSTVMQQDQTSFSGLAARARLRSARIVAGFELMPYVEYWRNHARIDEFGISSTRKDATLGADVCYTFRREGWRPYLGAGFGLHFLASEVDAPTLGLDHASDSVVRGALSALGGITFPLTKHLEDFMEVKYHHLPDESQLKLNFGIAWRR